MARGTRGAHGLQVRRERHGASVVLQVDIATVSLLVQNLTTATKAAKPPSPVILDLSQVTFLGAVGLAALVEHTDRCARHGTPLQVVADQHAILHPIQITGLGDLLNLRHTLSHALDPPA